MTNFFIHRTIGKRWSSKDILKKENLTSNAMKKKKQALVLKMMKIGRFGEWLRTVENLKKKSNELIEIFLIIS